MLFSNLPESIIIVLQFYGFTSLHVHIFVPHPKIIPEKNFSLTMEPAIPMENRKPNG